MNVLAHLVFVVLHVLAVFFFCWPLFITVPAHLLFYAITARKTKR
jgi:hypothetical protein